MFSYLALIRIQRRIFSFLVIFKAKPTYERTSSNILIAIVTESKKINQLTIKSQHHFNYRIFVASFGEH